MRQVVGIEFQSKRPKNFQGRWKKGYKLVTALVMDGGKLDEAQFELDAPQCITSSRTAPPAMTAITAATATAAGLSSAESRSK